MIANLGYRTPNEIEHEFLGQGGLKRKTSTVRKTSSSPEPFVCLDGTLLRTDRVAARTETGNNLWYSGKHKAFGGNVKVLTDHTGVPIWTAPVEPGSTHDITAARVHALPTLYRAASLGLPTLADKGYTGAGTGHPHPPQRLLVRKPQAPET